MKWRIAPLWFAVSLGTDLRPPCISLAASLWQRVASLRQSPSVSSSTSLLIVVWVLRVISTLSESADLAVLFDCYQPTLLLLPVISLQPAVPSFRTDLWPWRPRHLRRETNLAAAPLFSGRIFVWGFELVGVRVLGWFNSPLLLLIRDLTLEADPWHLDLSEHTTVGSYLSFVSCLSSCYRGKKIKR